MKYERTITLKDGTPCLLKSATVDDAAEIYNVFNRTHAETDFLLTYPEENSFGIDGERDFLKRVGESADEVEIAAIVDGKIVGSAGIESVGRKEKVRHRTEFGISILKDYWGRGIGRALTDACIECAKQAGYRQMELTVVADNKAAMALYQSVGFVEFGRNPMGFRSRLSGWQETVLMRLEL